MDETEKALRKAEQFVAANCDAQVVDLDAGDPEVASLCKRLADGKLETEIEQVKRSERRRFFGARKEHGCRGAQKVLQQAAHAFADEAKNIASAAEGIRQLIHRV